MSRLRVERVLESYKRIGAIPAQGVLWDPVYKKACGLGACFVSEYGAPGNLTVLQAAGRLGFGGMYASGFIQGFDDWPDESTLAKAQEAGWGEEWEDGFSDGRDAASAAFGALTTPVEGGTIAT